jgi:hypothetical protein
MRSRAAARRLGTKKTEPMLRRLCDDTDEIVARAAAGALAELLGDERFR